MASELPEFEKRPKSRVMPLMMQIFNTQLTELHQYEDGHYRVTFKSGIFTFQDEQVEPTRSQWATLKKRLKRHDRRLFLFKEYGKIPCDSTAEDGQDCYFLDFGFFLHA